MSDTTPAPVDPSTPADTVVDDNIEATDIPDPVGGVAPAQGDGSTGVAASETDGPDHAAPTQTAHKAVLGTIVAFVIAVLGGIQLAIASGADLANWQTWLNIVLVALAGGAGTGGTVYGVANKTKA